MKKKTILFIAAAVVVLCVAGVILFFQFKLDDPSDASTAVAGELDFKGMITTADRMLASGDVITMNNHEYLVHEVERAFEYHPEAFSYTSETYSIDTSKLVISTEPTEINSPEWNKQHILRYLLLLTQVLEEVPPDCIYLPFPLEIDYTASIVIPPVLYISPGYKAAGYESAYECYRYGKKDTCPQYLFYLGSTNISHYQYKSVNYYLELLP